MSFWLVGGGCFLLLLLPFKADRSGDVCFGNHLLMVQRNNKALLF